MPPKSDKPTGFTIYFDVDYVEDLRMRLKQHGVTQKDLAAEAGIPDTQLSRWMSQRPGYTMRVDSMKRLELALWRILERREKTKRTKG